MKILDRYLLKEMIVPFLIGTVAVVLMFQANELIAYGREMNLSSIPPLALLQMIIYRTPEFLAMTLPVGTALATSLTVSRLARESEITAMRSAGLRVFRLMVPLVGVGLLIALANFAIVERVMPVSNLRFKKLRNQVIQLALAPSFKSNVLIQLRSGMMVSIGNVQSDPKGGILLNQILLIERYGTNDTRLITAQEGHYHDGELVIFKPLVRVMQEQTLLSMKSQDELRLKEKISIEDLFNPPSLKESSITELRKTIRELRAQKQDPTEALVEYYSRFSVPAACAIFALVGPIFAFWFARSGPFVGVFLSLILVMLYYNTFVISTLVIGRQGLLHPALAAWLPNIIFAVLGLLGLRRLE